MKPDYNLDYPVYPDYSDYNSQPSSNSTLLFLGLQHKQQGWSVFLFIWFSFFLLFIWFSLFLLLSFHLLHSCFLACLPICVFNYNFQFLVNFVGFYVFLKAFCLFFSLSPLSLSLFLSFPRFLILSLSQSVPPFSSILCLFFFLSIM
jgi:hypothetical protein